MRRLPIRLRLTIAVAGTLAVVLAGVGAFVYASVRSQVDGQINQELRDHVQAVQHAVQRRGARPPGGDPIAAAGPEGTQVLAPDGSLVWTTTSAGREPVVDARQLRAALAVRGTRTFGEHRVRVQSAGGRGQRLIVVASTTLHQRNHALERMLAQMIIGGLAGVLAAALAAYAIARRAFRPFETMRRQAEAISAAEPGGRLAIPSSDDELARLGTTLNEMLGRLQRALENERRFVAEASHELRTPLAVLRAELELARSRPRSHAELEAALESVAEEAERLTRLADDLLLLARVDEGGLRTREEVPVTDLLEAAQSALETRATALGRAIEISAAPGLAVSADGAALHRALTNLVDNALRHGAGTVHLQAAEHGERIEVHVTDEGEGFPPAFLPVAFERFSRAGRSPDGTGLGLALVRAVAIAHGGTAAARTAPGGGADVWLSLPSAATREPRREPAPA